MKNKGLWMILLPVLTALVILIAYFIIPDYLSKNNRSLSKDNLPAAKPQAKESTQPIAITKGPLTAGKIEADVAIENGTNVLFLSKSTNRIFLAERKDPLTPQEGTEIIFLDEKGSPAESIEDIAVLSGESGKAVLQVGFKTTDDKTMQSKISVDHTKPIIELAPQELVGKIYLKGQINLAVLPDRFGDDLIYVPSEYTESVCPLPRAVFTLGFLPEGKGTIMTITAGDNQRQYLMKTSGSDFFTGIEVACAQASVFVSILRGDQSGRQIEVNATDDGKLIAEWQRPFFAQWRMAVCGADQYFARMWTDEELTKLKNNQLPIEGEFSQPPRTAVMYVYDRSEKTPPEIITPIDVLQQAIGGQRSAEVLDLEGIRTYRDADRWVPFSDFPVYFEWLGLVRLVDRPGVKDTVRHLCDDVLSLLEGLDKRTQEYHDFCLSLQKRCREFTQEPTPLKQFSDRIAGQLEDALRKANEQKLSPLAELAEAADKDINAGFASSSQEDDEGKGMAVFKEMARKDLIQRQKVLEIYRQAIKQIRDQAGLAMAEQSRLESLAEEIRTKTQQVLRKRYYLEGDWRGEEPMGDGRAYHADR